MFVLVCRYVVLWPGCRGQVQSLLAAVGVVYRSGATPEGSRLGQLGWTSPLLRLALCASFWVIEQGFIVSEANSKGHVNDRGSW